MPTIAQRDFAGGMSALADSTKTGTNQYRAGINVRARKNSLIPAFRPILYRTPNVVHQALFTLDDKLILIAGGTGYYLRDRLISAIGSFDRLSNSAEKIYHATVPAPSNYRLNDETVVLTVTTECAVLQDGQNRPTLLFPSLTSRRARTYERWSSANPEHVPIGKLMTRSGNKLYVVSADGKRIYQSVSGRFLDFVINIDTDGEKLGDPDTTYLSVSDAALTSIQPSQNNGFLAFTPFNAFAGLPNDQLPLIFGEMYIEPIALFPVGAINQESFTFANGESVFISPSGIHTFNQVAQLRRESNISPFGAPIIDYIVRPITRAATCTADDYTFFAVQTIFGDGILVYDNQLQAFVSFDPVGPVKEFAVLNSQGIARVFFITYANELYELPLYNGEKASATVYLGELNAGQANKQVRADKVHLAFNDVRGAGAVNVEIFGDRRSQVSQALRLETSRELEDRTPCAFPLECNTQLTALSFDLSAPYAYAIGAAVSWSASAALISAALDVNDREVSTISHAAEQISAESFLLLGDLRGEKISGPANFSAEIGKRYVFQSLLDNKTLLNGPSSIQLNNALDAAAFQAKVNLLNLPSYSQLFDFSAIGRILHESSADQVFLLGDVGAETNHKAIFSWLRAQGLTYSGIAGDVEWNYNAPSADRPAVASLLGQLGRPRYYLVSTAFVDFYCLNQDNGDDFNASGQIGRWLRIMLRNRRSLRKHSVVVCYYPPYSDIAGLARPEFRWNFRKYGAHLVIASGTNGFYERFYYDGVYYANVSTADATAPSSAPGGLRSVLGGLHLLAAPGRLRAEFISADGARRDEFAVVAP